MPHLILFRHAKAGPGSPGQSDFERRLTDRGRRDAKHMGRSLGRHPIDFALVSAATRTIETFQLAAREIEPSPRAEIARDLYLCGAGKLVRRIKAVPPQAKNLLVVAHNPDLHEVAVWLAGKGDGKESSALRAKFPTAAVAIFRLDIASWNELDPGRAALVCFATPADFED